jgi:thiamine pyrophosphate-dependent acetolactate synthase large subunit-like protein
MGFKAARVDRASDLSAALTSAIASPVPYLLDVIVSP